MTKIYQKLCLSLSLAILVSSSALGGRIVEILSVKNSQNHYASVVKGIEEGLFSTEDYADEALPSLVHKVTSEHLKTLLLEHMPKDVSNLYWSTTDMEDFFDGKNLDATADEAVQEELANDDEKAATQGWYEWFRSFVSSSEVEQND